MIAKLVSLEKSAYGHNQPTVRLVCEQRSNFRLVAAEVYSLAAKIELVSMRQKNADWVVVPKPHQEMVYLELVHDTPQEVEAAMAVLAQAV